MNSTMSKKDIERLEHLTTEGFKKQDKKINNLETAINNLAASTAREFDNVRSELKNEIKNEIKGLEDHIDKELAPIKNLITSNRIEKVEDDMRRVKTVLKMN